MSPLMLMLVLSLVPFPFCDRHPCRSLVKGDAEDSVLTV
jgi:hypothetical protein